MKFVKTSRLVITTALLLSFSTISSTISMAHEFWVEPLVPSGPLTQKISAHSRVGQNFKGEAMYYLPANIKNISISDGKTTKIIDRLIGDFPIFELTAKTPGLYILAYHSRPTKLTYKTMAKFKKFLNNVGLNWVLEQHLREGFPQSNFSETYIRYAKALVNRGAPSGNDRKIGLQFELVAQTNPYTLKLNNSVGQMSVLLLWKDKPLGNAQISIFEKPAPTKTENYDDAKLTKLKTNAAGLLTFPVSANKSYMLNSVQMVRGNSTTNVIWKSSWASLTFTIGKQN